MAQATDDLNRVAAALRQAHTERRCLRRGGHHAVAEISYRRHASRC